MSAVLNATEAAHADEAAPPVTAAKREPPAQAKELRAPDIERFRVWSKFEIASILREIATRRISVTLSFNAGADFVLSCVLDADPETGSIVFDCGADRATNRRLVDSNRFIFVSYLDKIRIQFAGTVVKDTTFEGGPALRVQFPESLVRLQRREFYRVQPMMSRPAICRVPDPANPRKTFETRVIDLGAGGAGVLATERLPIETGVVVEGCSLDLPEAGRFGFSADPGYVIENAGAKGTGVRYGLRFRGLDRGAAATIQRYIMKLDRDRRGRE